MEVDEPYRDAQVEEEAVMEGFDSGVEFSPRYVSLWVSLFVHLKNFSPQG